MESEYDSSRARRPFSQELEDMIQQMLDADEARYEQKDLVNNIVALAPSTATDLAVVRAAIAALPQPSALVAYTTAAGVSHSQQRGLSFAQQQGLDIHGEYRPTIRATARIAAPDALPSSTAAGAIGSGAGYSVLAAPQEIGALPRTAQMAALPRAAETVSLPRQTVHLALPSGAPQYAALLPAVSTHVESPLEVAVSEPKRRRAFRAFETFHEQKQEHPSLRRFATQAMKLAAGFVFAAASMSSKPFEHPAPALAPLPVAPVVVSAPHSSYYEQLARTIEAGVFDRHVVDREPTLTSTFGRRDLYEWRDVKRTAKGKTVTKRVKVDIPGSRNHLGIDIFSAPRDTNKALAEGYITHIDRGSGMNGAYIKVATMDTLSGDTLFVTTVRHGYIPRKLKEGDFVRKGEVLSIVATRAYSGVKPHTHVEVTAAGGLYKNMKGHRLNTFCLYTPQLREKIIQNMERLVPGDLPSGFKYMEGESVREKLTLACTRQAYKIAYGQQVPATVTLASGREYYTLTPEEIRPARLNTVYVAAALNAAQLNTK